MRLISNSRAVALRAHSTRAWAAALFFGIVGVLGDSWSLFQDVLPIPPLMFAGLGLAFGVLGLIGRFVDQDL